MCQLSPSELIIFGGYTGEFEYDYYILETDKLDGKPTKIRKYKRSDPNKIMFAY